MRPAPSDPGRRGVLRLISLGVAALARPASAQTGPELRLLAAELPPYSFHEPPPTVSENGAPRGIVHEAVREMARRVGHSGSIEYMPWARAQELAMRGPRVGILSLTRSPEREARYRWVQRILTDDLVLVGGTGVDVSELERVRDRPVGVLLRSGAEALLRERGFSRVLPAAEEWINATRLRERRLDAWLAPRLMVIHAYREVGGDVGGLVIGRVVRSSEIWFAASPDVAEEEAELWRAAFSAMQADGAFQAMLDRYARLRPEPIPDAARRDAITWVN
jgi:polar amino acid transport system substrate-binding protein